MNPGNIITDRLKAARISNGNLIIMDADCSIGHEIDKITDATAINPYCVIIPPGIYDETIILKDYVSISGSGRNVTRIKNVSDVLSYSGSGAVDLSNMTIEAFSNGTSVGLSVEESFSGILDIFNCSILKVDSLKGAIHLRGAGVVNAYNSSFLGFETACGIFTGEYNIYNCDVHSMSGTVLWQSGKTGSVGRAFNCRVHSTNTGLIYGLQVGHAGEFPELDLFNTTFDIESTDSLAIGTYVKSGTLRMHGGKVFADGAVAGGKDIMQVSPGTVNLYGVNYRTSVGTLMGTQKQQGQTITLAADGTFGPEDGNILAVDPGGLSRNYNPAGDFAPWTQVTIINMADNAETLTFDSDGLSQSITQNQRGLFVFDGTNWLKIFVS